MKKQAKRWLYSVLLIVAFALLSAINVCRMIQKNNSDLILLFAIACFFFAYWLCDLLFSVKFFKLHYKLFRKPMSKSMTMDIMGIEVASEKKAYQFYQKMIRVFPYISLAVLGMGILLLHWL